MDLATCRCIIVEGPIGAGKTSLARQLAHHIDGRELLERPEENPFLARFYEDMARYALPTQLTFLFQRVDQLRDVGQFDLFHRATVADFLLDKDPLFARINLTDAEYALYQKVYRSRDSRRRRRISDLPAGARRDARASAGAAFISSARFPPTTSRASPTRTAAISTNMRRRLMIVNSERLNFVDNPIISTCCDRIAGMRGRRESSILTGSRDGDEAMSTPTPACPPRPACHRPALAAMARGHRLRC
jgi:hypothetical protein